MFLCFREQFIARWHLCYLFQRTVSFSVPYEGKSVILLYFALTLFLFSQKPTSRLTSLKTN